MPPDSICAKTTPPSSTLLHWLVRGPMTDIQETYLTPPPDEPLYQSARSGYSQDVACTLYTLTQTSPARANTLLLALTETDVDMATTVANRLAHEDRARWGFAASVLGSFLTYGDEISKGIPEGLIKAELIRRHRGDIRSGTRLQVTTPEGTEALRIRGVTAILTQPPQVFLSISSERAEALSQKAEEQRLTAMFFFPPDMDMLCQIMPELDCSMDDSPLETPTL